MNEQRESMVDSVRHLGKDLSDLFRAELGLFKQEASQQLRGLTIAGVWVAAGAVMGLAFLGAFTALLIMVLSLALAPWLAALIVTAVWGIVAASLIAAAAAKLKATLPLEFDQTTRSVKEDIEWIKTGINSAK
jgi:hypothetical protein